MHPSLHKLRWWIERRRKEDEIREELQFHLDEEADRSESDGLTKDEARRAARQDLGNLRLVEENVRAIWTFTWLEQFAQDVRYALRTMLNNRTFTCLAVFSLALGIGANTAIYSFVDSILLRSLPVKDPKSLVVLKWRARDPRVPGQPWRPFVMHSMSGSAYDDEAGLTSGIFPFPAVVAGGHKPVLSSVGITLTVNARSKHPDLAFEMIKALTGAWGKIEYTRNLGLSPNGPISAEAIAYQMQSLKDPLYPEFLKLQPTGTTRVIFTPPVEEALTQGMQALFVGQKTPRAVMESVEAASQKAGVRKFKVG